MSTLYYKELQKILEDKTDPPKTEKSKEQLKREIDDLTNSLRGPLDNGERLNLVEARRALQKQLAAKD